MLVLSRKSGERIHIGDGITLTVVAVEGQRVRLGIAAPPAVAIRREELDLVSAGQGVTSAAGSPRPARLPTAPAQR